MRILYFSFVELDIPNACRTHTLGILRGLSHHGCRVEALVPRPLHAFPEIPNVRFHYLRPWQFSALGLLWIKILAGLLMCFLCLKNTYDFIYIRELETNPGPRLCSRLFKIPLYLEINELFLPFHKDKGAGPGYLNRVERHQRKDFRQASGLVVPSIPMCKWIKNYYRLPGNKVHMVLNGSDQDHFYTKAPRDIKQQVRLADDAFCLGFLGNVHDRTDFYTILNAMAGAQDQIPGLHLLVIGEGPDLQTVKQLVSKLELQHQTTFTGYVLPDQLFKILPAMDVGLIMHTKRCCDRYGSLATKLSTYALYRLAVIAAGSSLEDYPTELRQNLYLVPPENPELLRDLLIKIYQNPSERIQKAKNLHAFASRHLTWNSVAHAILKIQQSDRSRAMRE